MESSGGLPLEYKVDLALRAVLKKHGACVVERVDVFADDLRKHMYYLCIERHQEISQDEAAEDWREKYAGCEPSKSGGNENEQIDFELRAILKEHGAVVVKRLDLLAEDFRKHRYYMGLEQKRFVSCEESVDNWVGNYTWYESKEFLDIEHEYKKGVYDWAEQELETFVAGNGGLIEQMRLRRQRQLKKPIDSLRALKWLLLESKTLNVKKEVAQQMQKIEEAIGKKPANPDIIAFVESGEAAEWRAHYTMVLEFIVHLKQAKLLMLMGEGRESAA